MFCSIHSFSPPSGLIKLAVASKARAMDASLADIAKAWSLHEAGALTLEEFTSMKASILLRASSPPPPVPSSCSHGASTHELTSGLGGFLKSLSGMVDDLRSPKLSFGSLPARSVGDDVVSGTVLPPDKCPRSSQKHRSPSVQSPDSLLGKRRQQPTLYQAGVESIRKIGNKTVRLTASIDEAKPLQTPAQKKQKNTFLQCRWCDEVFNHAPARKAHEKVHTGPQRGQKSMFDVAAIRKNLSDKQRDKEIEVQVRWCINDIIKEVEKIGIPVVRVGEKPLKYRKNGTVDKRSFNAGSSVRQGRSLAFKARVSRTFLDMQTEYPDFASEATELVADSFNCTRQQVNAWLKKKEKILHEAKGKNKHKQRDRKQKGRFQKAEAEVYDQFKAARAEGQRVGPRWITQCARREVRKAYTGTPLGEEAKSFSAKRGWLCRFCRRWKIALRRKTNVKRTPILERLGKIKRYFALLRLRLKSYANKPGYHPKWSMWLPKNRWSLDQVPAGFFAPTSTYEHKGARRVHIASNGSADSHRECTLQVMIRCFKVASLPSLFVS